MAEKIVDDVRYAADAILLAARARLAEAGIDAAYNVSPLDPAGAVLIAEAVNLAAKEIDEEEFYALKPAVWCAAALTPGVDAWLGGDGCYYLSAPGAGEVCAHDPYGEIERLDRSLRIFPRRPDRTWSGIRRQHWAFLALASRAARRVLAAATDGLFSDAQADRILRRMTRRIASVT